VRAAVLGATQFAARAEIRNALAALALVANPATASRSRA
jgi:superfamily I DNA/RNA helicase